MKFEVDSNVLISALLKPLSVPAKALNIAREKGRICLSEKTCAEIKEVLLRDKFDKYIPKNKRIEQLEHIFEQAELVLTASTILACRDPKDNVFLECAVAVQAAFIISGDKDLLTLNPFQNISIVTPSHFISLIED